jgi:hypothetical protein
MMRIHICWYVYLFYFKNLLWDSLHFTVCLGILVCYVVLNSIPIGIQMVFFLSLLRLWLMSHDSEHCVISWRTCFLYSTSVSGAALVVEVVILLIAQYMRFIFCGYSSRFIKHSDLIECGRKLY